MGEFFSDNKPETVPNGMISDLKKVDESTYAYIFEQDVSVPLKAGRLIRTNVYYPKDVRQGQKYPVIITYGPYGKDVPYAAYVGHRLR